MKNNNAKPVSNKLSSSKSTLDSAPRYSKPQRIAAMIGIIAIFGLAIATLVVAITDSTGRLFQSFLMLTIAAPILIWIYIWLYGKYSRRHTIASIDLIGMPGDETTGDTTTDDVTADDMTTDDATDDDMTTDDRS